MLERINITELPADILSEFVFELLKTDAASLLVLRQVSSLFQRFLDYMIIHQFNKCFGRQIVDRPGLCAYSGAFFNMLAKEPVRLEVLKQCQSVNLNAMTIQECAINLPESLDFFIVWAVSNRAFEALDKLCESIRIKYDKSISLERVVESIYLQAMLSYNKVEFIRLQSFVPLGANVQVGRRVTGPNGVCKYEYKSLKDHATLFGNVRLAEALSVSDAMTPQRLPPA